MIDVPQDDVNRFAPSEDTAGTDGAVPAPVPKFDYSKIEVSVIAKALGAYALNVVYGAILSPFELEHLIELAKVIGCTVTEKHLSYVATRVVLEELMKERREQIEVHGYTLAFDDANPAHAHEQVLERAYALPNAHTRKDLVELAAIAVAEIERLDRAAAKLPTPETEPKYEDQFEGMDKIETGEQCSTDSRQQSSWTRPKVQLQHTR